MFLHNPWPILYTVHNQARAGDSIGGAESSTQLKPCGRSLNIFWANLCFLPNSYNYSCWVVDHSPECCCLTSETVYAEPQIQQHSDPIFHPEYFCRFF